jgi:hypothetical protein
MPGWAAACSCWCGAIGGRTAAWGGLGLADRDCPIGGALSLRIQPNPAFRLPPRWPIARWC